MQVHGKLLIVLLVCLGYEAMATHNRAGEITYMQIGDLTIRAIITTYTKTSSVPADRDTLRLHWGDGTSTMVPRSNGNGMPLPNDIKVNFYIAEHTYPGRATYTLSMMDPNRIGGITNVNPPNSDGVPFYIETTFTFLNTQFQGFNSSPVLLQPPLDYACVGKRYIHNPNAWDPDGDSLSYELIIPLQDSGVLVPNYIFPDQIGPGPENQISLDPMTGDFVWNAPQVAGTYNIAFRIHEYRGGVRVNSMIRDMQILVLNCDNNPPVIVAEDEYCVIAGELLAFDLSVTDPDSNQKIVLTATGGPFEVSEQVSVMPAGIFLDPTYSSTFRWQTSCNEIAEQQYTVVFRAADNFFGGTDTTGLTDLKTVRIKVVGPPPENVRAQTTGDLVKVMWDKPYSCEVTEDEYFQGFSVWRREGSNEFPFDSCAPGLEGRGYTQIGFDVMDSDGDQYVFDDVDVENGKTYCYRVLAEFAQLTPSGNAFNRVQSLPSDEFCLQLNRDIPLITNVDVRSTSNSDGAIEIRWVKPLTSSFDTIENPGPYRFQLRSSPGIGTLDFTDVAGADFRSASFSSLNDTSFLHNGLGTSGQAYTYEVEFYVGGSLYDASSAASSVFLNLRPTDRAMVVSWDYEIPWNNYEFEVYRALPGGDFDLVGSTSDLEFRDPGLANGTTYCYFVRSIGSYGIELITDPLLNSSQEVCGIPKDDVAACPPIVEVSNICAEADDTTPEEAFMNTISWTEDICNDEPIAEYRVYYTPTTGGDFELVGVVPSGSGNEFQHQPEVGIAGCYAVTNVDLSGNESDLSVIHCVENCPLYILPNVFTPNGDGDNDFFIPFSSRFIERIELSIFNRWGNLVFQTTDPDINWDGTNLNGNALADGVYHYVCRVFEKPLPGLNQQGSVLEGYIHLINGSD